jgi:magnesium transporter
VSAGGYPPSVIRVRRYLEDGEVTEEIDPDDVSECLDQRGALLWVDVEQPTADDVECLAKEFDVHHLAAEDLLEPSLRPRLARFADHLLLVVRDPWFKEGRFDSREVDLVFGDGWLITVRKPGEEGAPPTSVSDLIDRFERRRRQEGASDEGFLLYVVLDAIVDRFFEVSDVVEERLSDVEADIFSDRRPRRIDHLGGDVGITERLYRLRQDLVGFRRSVAPLREALAPLLRGEAPFIGDEAVIHLRDVYDLVVRATEMVEAQRDLLNGALDAHLSITSNRMNLVMKQATSWGAILILSSLVAGIYGMNFEHMPELHLRYGYLYALGLMAVITLALYVTFKRRDWL